MTTDEIKALMDGATPGPWGIDPAYISEVNAPNGLTVASCWHRQCEGASITVSGINPVSPEESAANARLIAAAPDLAALALRQADEIADLKSSVVAFCAPWAFQYAREHGLPDGHIFATHYDILERAGARMAGIVRHGAASTEAAE